MGAVESLKETIFGIGGVVAFFVLLGWLLSRFVPPKKRDGFVVATCWLISGVIWFGLASYAFEYVNEWTYRIVIIILFMPIIMLNISLLEMRDAKGIRYTLKNIDKPFKLLIIKIKRFISEEKERSGKAKANRESDFHFLIGEEE